MKKNKFNLFNRNNLYEDINILFYNKNSKNIEYNSSTEKSIKTCYIIAALSFMFLLINIFLKQSLIVIFIHLILFVISIILLCLLYYKILNNKGVEEIEEIEKTVEKDVEKYEYYKNQRKEKRSK